MSEEPILGYLYIPEGSGPYPPVKCLSFGCTDSDGNEIGFNEGMSRLSEDQQEQVIGKLFPEEKQP